MPASSAFRRLLLVCVGLAFLAAPAHAQEAEEEKDQEADKEDKEKVEDLQRDTPSGRYIDPASFFRFHGYATLTYSEVDSQLGTTRGAVPQILVSQPSPRTGENESGFRGDAALFVGGEPFEGVGSVMEIHFVGDATDPVITEAKITWDFLDTEGSRTPVRLIAGRYWWPFGIHNAEWFSSVNRFSLVSPAAAEVVPPHYNEVGAMLEGEALVSEHVGLNYLVSVGNGANSFRLGDNVRNTTFDGDANRTVTGRAGVVVLGDELDLELGFSVASGELRTGTDDGFAMDDPRRYEADMLAYGPDLRLDYAGFDLRSYFYFSEEDLQVQAAAPGVTLTELEREGLTVEPAYTFDIGLDRFQEITVLGRFSYADEETMAGESLRRYQYGAGVVLGLTRNFSVDINYMAQEEGEDLLETANDAFTASLTAEF